jgi:hypothetical protein
VRSYVLGKGGSSQCGDAQLLGRSQGALSYAFFEHAGEDGAVVSAERDRDQVVLRTDAFDLGRLRPVLVIAEHVRGRRAATGPEFEVGSVTEVGGRARFARYVVEHEVGICVQRAVADIFRRSSGLVGVGSGFERRHALAGGV